MRVIAGTAKNRRLRAPAGLHTRPITDMIKGALFNVVGSDIKGSSLLDLFAGSGSVGIEALSRGADKVIFVDNSSEAIKMIYANLTHCGFTDKFQVYKNDVFKAIQILRKKKIKFNFIYVDPPFTNEAIFIPVLTALDQANILEVQGLIIIRTQRKKSLPGRLENLEEFRINNYGESTLHYYRFIQGG